LNLIIWKEDKMTVYKLTVNLDATLAVQQENGSFNYFKPSIGAEFYTDATEDLKSLNQKFGELYVEVIGPNFKAVVEEFLVNSDEKEASEEQVDSGCRCGNESCDNCKPLEIGEKPESEIVHYDGVTLLPINEETTELDRAKTIYHQGPQALNNIDTEDLPKEEWE
jgi:hypothetical protein